MITNSTAKFVLKDSDTLIVRSKRKVIEKLR